MWGIFERPSLAAAEPPKSGTITSVSATGNRMRVRFQATEWFAFSEQPLTVQPGDRVQITGRLNATTLLIANADGRTVSPRPVASTQPAERWRPRWALAARG